MRQEVAELEEEANEMAKWMSEKKAIDAIREAKEKLEEAAHQLEIAERQGDYEGRKQAQVG